MIVYEMVTKEQDGRLVSLMEKGKRQIEYRLGEAGKYIANWKVHWQHSVVYPGRAARR
jgi:hypothetical protein